MERQQSFLLSSCTRCSGDLVLRQEDEDLTGTCLQCGNVLYMKRGVGLQPWLRRACRPQRKAACWAVLPMATSGVRPMFRNAAVRYV